MLDEALIALASCPVIEQKDRGGHIVFNPYPTISTSDNLILSHEICHKLAGASSFNKFATACHVRQDPLFNFVLNLLVDWYDESNNSQYSMYLHKRVLDLRKTVTINKNLPTPIKELMELYCGGAKPKGFPNPVDGIEDLIVYADKFISENKNQAQFLQTYFTKHRLGSGAGPDLVENNKRGSFYLKTVAKYNYVIDIVASLWLRNKYKWDFSYFGEINWKNLPGLMIGDKIGAPVYKLFHKLDINRRVFLVVDRSGSTDPIKVPIMETVIILAESFRRCNVPVSILNIGTVSVINKINEPLDFGWFEPITDGGTPLGATVNLIKESFPEDYLLIVTDGQPYDPGCKSPFELLIQAVNRFKGYDLTFVIGDSFREYYTNMRGHAVSVEPTTIIRELINDSTLSR